MLRGNKFRMLNSIFAFPVVSAGPPGSEERVPGPPRGPVLGVLDQASVMGHDFVLWQMKGKFQGH